MSSIPYNYGSYIDAKVSMTDTGHVSAGKQIQSPASAGSRGLAKTTQFTNDRTQMQMGNSPIAESMVEIRNILNRIDGVNVPANEMNELADDDKIEYTKVMLDISAIKDRVEALSVDEDAKKSAIQSLTNAEEALVALDESAVREDDGLTQAYKQIAQLASDVDKNPEDAEDQWELASEVARPITKILKQIMDYDKGEQMPDGSDMSYADMFKKVSMLANKGAQTNDPKMAAEIFKTMSSVYDMKQVAEESVSEDVSEQEKIKVLLQWFQNKHDTYRNDFINDQIEAYGKKGSEVKQAVENNDELIELENIVDALKSGSMKDAIETINSAKYEFSGIPGEDDDFVQVIEKLGIPKDTFWFTKNESVAESKTQITESKTKINKSKEDTAFNISGVDNELNRIVHLAKYQ